MKALFLAGGKGLRMQPLTDTLPKPMVPVMNKPLLERTMMNLKKNGITDMVISTCYRPDSIKNYFGNGKRLGLDIQYIVEDTPLGTGGAIKKAESHFDDTFIVLNSDIVSDIDIKKMIDFHKSKKALVTIAVTEVEDPSAYGVIETDANGYAVSFVEKPLPGQASSNYINAGIYIFEPEVLKDIAADCVVSVERDTFPKILAEGNKMGVFKNEGYWIDIGTLEKYRQVHLDILSKKCRLVGCGLENEYMVLGQNVKIHPTVRIFGSVYIGDNVEIGAKAVICNSVIGNDSLVGPECRIVECILWNDVKVSGNVRLKKTIVPSGSLICTSMNYSDTVFTGDAGNLCLQKDIVL
jgi:mannose-1-phosphate guanylyltransferase